MKGEVRVMLDLYLHGGIESEALEACILRT